MVDLVVRNVRVVSEDGTFEGGVAVRGGKIAALGSDEVISALAEGCSASDVIDGGGLYLLPGGVDPHVHIRYPGGAHRETFITGTRSAAAGGVTTIIEHPISSPPQFSPEILKTRTDSLLEGSSVDVAFLGAAGMEHADKISSLAECGVVGYKTFLHAAPEGREKEFEGLTSKDNFELHEVIKAVTKTGLRFAAHGEDNDLVAGGIAQLRREGRTAPIDHARSRPPIVELMAVDRLISLAELEGASLYLVHISTPQAVEAALEARGRGLDVIIETCPQYLYLSENDLIKHGVYAKCNPSLRKQAIVDRLWGYISDGSIDTVGSDHAPFTVAEKEKNPNDIFVAPAGFPGLETRMGLMLKAVIDGKITLKRAVELIATNPAKAYGLYPAKGAIRIGADADMILVDLNREWTVRAERMETMSRDTAKVYEGWRLPGYLDSAWLRGMRIVKDGEVISTGKEGRFIKLGGK